MLHRALAGRPLGDRAGADGRLRSRWDEAPQLGVIAGPTHHHGCVKWIGWRISHASKSCTRLASNACCERQRFPCSAGCIDDEMENRGFEPLTSAVRSQRSTN